MIETVYLCLKYDCFIYHGQNQLCLDAYWQLMKSVSPISHKYLAVLDTFHRKGWWLRFETGSVILRRSEFVI